MPTQGLMARDRTQQGVWVSHQTVPEVEEENGANGSQSRDQAANVAYDTQVIPVHRGDVWRGNLGRRRNERW